VYIVPHTLDGEESAETLAEMRTVGRHVEETLRTLGAPRNWPPDHRRPEPAPLKRRYRLFRYQIKNE
jgi:hypothetical protein